MTKGFPDIVAPEKIDLSSINGLTSFHPVLLASLYVLIVVVLAATLVLLKKKHGLKEAVRYGVLLSFILAGFFHAAASELLWGKWLCADWQSFSVVGSGNKPAAIDGDFYKFILQCKKSLGGSNYSLYPHVRLDNGAMNYYDRKLEYYLLPARKTLKSGYIIVLNDTSVTFDETTGVFKGEDGTLLFATLLHKFAPEAYMLKVVR